MMNTTQAWRAMKHHIGVVATRGYYRKPEPPTDGLSMARERISFLLKECTSTCERDLIHAELIMSGLQDDTITRIHLFHSYLRSKSHAKAMRVIDALQCERSYDLNTLIRFCNHNEYYDKALEFYLEHTCIHGIEPDTYVFPSVLKSCAELFRLSHGKKIHGQIIKHGLDDDIYVVNSLVYMYSRCGTMEDAHDFFNEMGRLNAVAWNSLIRGYVIKGNVAKAFELFKELMYLQDEIVPSSITMSCILPAFAAFGDVKRVKEVHGYAIRMGFGNVVFVGNGILDLYVKFGIVGDACKLFDRMPDKNRVTWSVMIKGHSHCGDVERILFCLDRMRELGIRPDVITWTDLILGFADLGDIDRAFWCFRQIWNTGLRPDQPALVHVLKACQYHRLVNQGRQIHCHCIKCGFADIDLVSCGLINMYSKCDWVEDAETVFNSEASHDAVSWTAMIGCFAYSSQFDQAIESFQALMQSGLRPNQVTLGTMVSLFGQLGVLELGKALHCQIVKSGYQSQQFCGSSVGNMYAKCGKIEDATKGFYDMPHWSLYSWNSMIFGYASHGHAEEAIGLLDKMQADGIRPDNITLLGVLSACYHAGLLDKGAEFFNRMSKDYGIEPDVEHYASMVNILGRVGKIQEAWDLIHRMPLDPKPFVWGAFLNACKVQQNIEFAEIAANILFKLEPHNIGNYVMLSNMYAEAGKWDKVEEIRRIINHQQEKNGDVVCFSPLMESIES